MELKEVVARNGDGKMFVEELLLSPGESKVENEQHDLFYFVVSGYALMNVDAYGHNLEQETSVFIPKNTEHTFTNTGKVDLLLVRYGTK